MNPADPKSYPVKTAKLSELEMTYCDAEPAGTPKDTIIFVHGFPEFWFEWRHQIPYFVALGYRVIAPNTRGYNPGEPHPREADVEAREAYYSYGRAAKDLKELLDHVGVKQAIVVGHDWGALLVQRFALLYKEYFKKLVLVCIPYLPPSSEPYVPLEVAAKHMPMLNYQVYFNKDKAEDELNGDMERFIDTMFRPGAPNTGEGMAKITAERGIMGLNDGSLPKSTLLTDDEVAYYAEFYRSIGGLNGPLQWYRMGAQSHDEFANVNKHIGIETLFVGAEHDPFSGPAFAAPMKNFIKNLTMKEVKNAGHWVAYERHAELNTAIGEWLEEGK